MNANIWGLLGPEARHQALYSGLLNLGGGLIAAGAPTTQPGMSARGLIAGTQGFNDAINDRQQIGMRGLLVQNQLAEAKRKEAQRAEIDKFIGTLPPEQQGMARAAPEKFFGQMANRMFPAPGKPGDNFKEVGGQLYDLSDPKNPRAVTERPPQHKTRELSVGENRIQPQESLDGGLTWKNVGSAYPRRDNDFIIQEHQLPDGTRQRVAYPRAAVVEAMRGGGAPAAGAAAPTAAAAPAGGPGPRGVVLGSEPPKPVSAESAKAIGLVEAGLRGVADLERLAFDDKGNLKKWALAVSSAPSWAGLISEDARLLATAAYAAADAELRLKTGAQAPQSEIERSAKALLPNYADSPTSARAKLKVLKEYLGGIHKQLQPGKSEDGGGGEIRIDTNGNIIP